MVAKAALEKGVCQGAKLALALRAWSMVLFHATWFTTWYSDSTSLGMAHTGITSIINLLFDRYNLSVFTTTFHAVSSLGAGKFHQFLQILLRRSWRGLES